MLQTAGVTESRAMINKRDVEERAREIAQTVQLKAFAERSDELVGEVSDKPLVVEKVSRVLTARRLIEAIVHFRETDNNLVIVLPWELTLAAMLKVIFALNAPDTIAVPSSGNEGEVEALDVSPPPAIDRRERAADVITKQAREAIRQTRQDIHELGEELHQELTQDGLGSPKERPVGRHPDNVVFFDDVPDLQDEHSPRMSPLADQILDFSPVLIWWSLLKHRDDAEEVLQREVFSKGVAKHPLVFRDLLLIAIWQQASFPEDLEDVADSLFEELDLGADSDVDDLRHRLYRAIVRASHLQLKHLETVRDEILEDLGALLCPL